MKHMIAKLDATRPSHRMLLLSIRSVVVLPKSFDWVGAAAGPRASFCHQLRLVCQISDPRLLICIYRAYSNSTGDSGYTESCLRIRRLPFQHAPGSPSGRCTLPCSQLLERSGRSIDIQGGRTLCHLHHRSPVLVHMCTWSIQFRQSCRQSYRLLVVICPLPSHLEQAPLSCTGQRHRGSCS